MNKLSDYCNKLEELIYHSKTELILPKLDSINTDKESSKYFFIVLWKLTNGIETVNLLFINILTKPQFADSIFICLRALIADLITINYVIFKSDFDNEKLPEKIKELKFDHVKFAHENLALYKDLYRASDQDIINRKEELRNSYPEFFDGKGELKSNIQKLKSIKGMVKEMNCNAPNKSIFIDEIIRAFEFYDLYSKYEHLGEFTIKLVQRSYLEESDKLIGETKSCLELLLKFQYQLFTEFYKKEELETTKYWKCFTEIKSIV